MAAWIGGPGQKCPGFAVGLYTAIHIGRGGAEWCKAKGVNMLPKTIKILGLDYQVQPVQVISRDEFLLGRIDFVDQIIYVDANLQTDRRKVVLLHEILHGILEALGFNEASDEHLVQSLATALHQVSIDNPGLFT